MGKTAFDERLTSVGSIETMLSRIKIKNFALIETLQIAFDDGLNVITGSTGAGKSIIVGALELALGARGSEEMIRSGESETVVEACFTIDDGLGWSGSYDIPVENNSLSIRREYRKKGGSRAVVNGKQVPLSTLKEISDNLVSILGQHSHQALLDPATHLGFLDHFAVPDEELSSLRLLYERATELRDRISYADRHSREIAERLELISFQMQEIEKAKLDPGEEENLINEKSILENVARLREAGETACSGLLESDDAVLVKIGEIEKALKEIPGNEICAATGLIGNAADLLRESVLVIRNIVDKVEDDPARLEQVNERLYELSRLKKKYGGSVEAALEYLEKSRSELDELKSGSVDKKRMLADFREASETLNSKAVEISSLRRQAGKKLEVLVEAKLADMGMPRAKFVIGLETHPDSDGLYEFEGKRLRGDSAGFETAEFQFCANPGEELKPLARIASGGEISRVMLALKNAFIRRKRGGCEVFDEIDVGISGDVAAKIAGQLKELAGKHQVICVTHLHQIASAADNHYLVFMEKSGRRSVTSIKKLDHQGRIREIASLLSGARITEKAIAGARELLEG